MLTKRIIIATITILVLVAFTQWGTDFVKARVIDSAKPEKAELTKQIDAATSSIAGIPKPDGQLVNELARLETELHAVSQAIPASVDSTLAIDSILALAYSCNVTAVPLQTSDWGVIEKQYLVYKVQINVMGSFEQITTFISRLENELFETLIIENLGVTGGLVNDTEPNIATLQLAIYSRK
jgi:Tfp pilus assembly protein PilO